MAQDRDALIRAATRDAAWVKRFWEKVDKRGRCWLWTRAVQTSGYGFLRLPGAKDGMALAHRVSWILVHESIPDVDGKPGCVRHACDNPRCVNPAHLKIGSHKENMQDRKQPPKLRW